MYRKKLYALLCCLSAAFFVPAALAQLPAPPTLPAGTSLLPERTLHAFVLEGVAKELATREVVDVAGQPFAQALRTLRLPPNGSFTVQLNAKTIRPVAKNDVLLARFFVRARESRDETGEARTAFVFEKAGAPYTKSLYAPIRVGSTWRQYRLPFVSRADYAPGQAQINFPVGFNPQTIEIADLSLVNYGKAVKLQDLPHTRLGYAGQEPNAPWRVQASERIEKHRKADLTIRVVDARGKPVANAQIHARMKRHAFGFGSVVNGKFLWEPESPDNRRYRETFVKLFNNAVDEGDMKWPGFEGSGKARSAKTLQWLKEHNIPLRGHVLVWPGWNWLPGKNETDIAKSPRGLRANYEAKKTRDGEAVAKAWLRERINDHIREQATYFKGRLTDWDVVNEPYTNHDLMDILGDEAMVEWFKTARAADPNAKLYLNDFGILRDDTAHQEHFYKTIQFLLDQGTPLDGIGEQSHMGSSLTPPERVLEILDRLARFNLPIQITEFDLEMPDEELQGEYLRDYMTVLFSHPAVTNVIMWGFWDGMHWKQNAPLFRRDWSLKPGGQAWIDLVFKHWWTDARGRTNAQGTHNLRGFLGDYEITVTQGAQTKTAPYTLAKNREPLTIVLN